MASSGIDRILGIGCTIIMLAMLQTGCTPEGSKARLTFTKYSNLKLGFTTQNYIQAVPVNLESAKKFVEYAAEKGYSWIELRDPDAVLTLDECKQIAALAEEKHIQIAYANQRGLLDEDFWEIFDRGVVNATVFVGPGTIRVLASGKELSENPEKNGWTNEEFQQLVGNADRAARIAAEHDLQLVVENGGEPLVGDGETFYGTVDFFKAVSDQVGWQFDTANFFSGARISATADQAGTFLKDHVDNLFYVHLKSSLNNQAQPVLVDNPLDFDVIFAALSQYNVPFVAIELLAIEDVDEIYTNLDRSVDYLKQRGFIASK